jgi:hypothetical protein
MGDTTSPGEVASSVVVTSVTPSRAESTPESSGGGSPSSHAAKRSEQTSALTCTREKKRIGRLYTGPRERLRG